MPLVEGLPEPLALGEMSPRWVHLAVGRARVEWGERLRLLVSEARAGQLALAQVDDGTARPRGRYLWRPPLVLEARVRFSHGPGELLGTAGFGLWNNPAPLWGTGMEASPRWLWFCYAGELRAAVAGGDKGAGLRGLLGWKPEPQELQGAPLPGPLTDWHDYRLAWLAGRVLCQVDGKTVLEAAHAPLPPLAVVMWMSNTRLGGAAPGHSVISRPQWMEVERLSLAAG